MGFGEIQRFSLEIQCVRLVDLAGGLCELSARIRMGKRGKKRNTGDGLVVFNSDQHEDHEGAVRQYKPLPGRVEKGEFDFANARPSSSGSVDPKWRL